MPFEVGHEHAVYNMYVSLNLLIFTYTYGLKQTTELVSNSEPTSELQRVYEPGSVHASAACNMHGGVDCRRVMVDASSQVFQGPMFWIKL